MARSVVVTLASYVVVAILIGSGSVTPHSIYGTELSDLDPAPSVEEFQKGGGKEYAASQYSGAGERGEKGYAGRHEQEKGAKGRHEKEGLKRQFAEAAGARKGHNHRDGYYSQHKEGEKGRKGFHFADEGRYAKGHQTKGRHNIHKLDEFKKNTDFFDKDHDEAFKHKYGGFQVAQGASAGSFDQGGHFQKAYDATKYGVLAQLEKGAHFDRESGHKNAQGLDKYFQDQEEFAKKGDLEGHKLVGFSSSSQH